MTQLARILLVEDNIHDIELFKIFLMEEEGVEMHLTAIETGEEVLEYLQNNEHPLPDLILLDVNLPRMDGFEILHEIRENLCLTNLPVSMLSTSNDEYDISRAYEGGAQHYMQKPANYPQLQSLVTALDNFNWQIEGDKKRIICSNPL